MVPDSSRQFGPSGPAGPQARAPQSGEEGLALVATLLVLALMGGLMAASLWGGMPAYEPVTWITKAPER